MLPGVAEICGLYRIDPYKSISEGTLIAMVRPAKAGAVLAALRKKRIPAADVGEVTKRGMVLVDGGRETPLIHPVVDPFWAAYFKAIQP